jgi:hypothetical protein
MSQSIGDFHFAAIAAGRNCEADCWLTTCKSRRCSGGLAESCTCVWKLFAHCKCIKPPSDPTSKYDAALEDSSITRLRVSPIDGKRIIQKFNERLRDELTDQSKIDRINRATNKALEALISGNMAEYRSQTKELTQIEKMISPFEEAKIDRVYRLIRREFNAISIQ